MTTEPDPDMMAAELVLGLLDGEERAAALRRTLSDRDFAREVDWWRRHLGDLFDEYRPVQAPQYIVDRIAAPPPSASRRPLWAAVAGAMAVAAVLLLLVLQRPEPVSLPRPEAQSSNVMIAALAPSDKRLTPTGATVDTDRGEIRVAATELAPPDKAAQLWIIRDGTPQSLGLLNRAGATRIALPIGERANLRSGAVLAISIEPPGGSPKPVPTGPVVATGTLAAT